MRLSSNIESRFGGFSEGNINPASGQTRIDPELYTITSVMHHVYVSVSKVLIDSHSSNSVTEKGNSGARRISISIGYVYQTADETLA